MKKSLLTPIGTATAALLAFATADAQRKSEEVPDTAVQAQLDAFSLIEGAEINLFAQEPLVANPVHMNWDQNGRLWVVCSPLYPHIKPGQEDSDKVVVLEDTDGDGVADWHATFSDDLHIPTAVLPGDGGVYVANAIEMLHLKDTDGDFKADETKVLLSGFGTEDTHHLLHTFRWGPEGEIWMNQSIYIHSHVETPYGVRRLLGGGMWTFRPETHRAEIYMKGLINPWGHAIDEYGQSFLTDGAGSEGINWVFPKSVFKTSPGASRTLSGLNPGQPKHCGAEFLTSSHVPENLSSSIAAPDFRGNRINTFTVSPNGSTYISSQGEDLVSSTHRAFRPIDIKVGPDGAIYIADWYNPIIQHGEIDFRDPRRDTEHGRIWRITFKGRDLTPFQDLDTFSESQLVETLNSPEPLHRLLAMTELRMRDKEAVLASLDAAQAPSGVSTDLHDQRMMWGRQAINRFDPAGATALLESDTPQIRSAALRSLYFRAEEHEETLTAAKKAITDPDMQVRVWGVSLLSEVDASNTPALALKALSGVEADDPLDFAVWSLLREHVDRWEPLTKDGNPFASIDDLLYAARAVNRPIALDQITKALAEGSFTREGSFADAADFITRTGGPNQLATMLKVATESDMKDADRVTLLDALATANKLRKLKPSGDLTTVSKLLSSKDKNVFAAAATLAGAWKLEDVRPVLETAFLTEDQDEAVMNSAAEALAKLGTEKTLTFFIAQAKSGKTNKQVKSLALKGLIQSAPIRSAPLAVSFFSSLGETADDFDVFGAFLQNQKRAELLTASLSEKILPKEFARQALQKASSAPIDSAALVKALQTAGDIKPMKMNLTPEEMNAMMVAVEETGDPHRGQEVYRRNSLQCIVCHAIGNSGGIIGPNLVSIGSSAPVDYLINSLLLPSEKIKEGYHTTLVTLKDGTAYAGAVAREDANELVIRDAGGNEHRIAKDSIASNIISPVSLMPAGLTMQLREDEFVDLVAFLAELGRDGDFKTPTNRFLRNWEALLPNDATRDAYGFYGPAGLLGDEEAYQWIPTVSLVGGGLPAGELEGLIGRGRGKLNSYRTKIKATSDTELKLRVFGPLAQLNAYVGDTEIDLPEDGTSATVSLPVDSGEHQIGLVYRNLGDTETPFGIEILNEPSAVSFD